MTSKNIGTGMVVFLGLAKGKNKAGGPKNPFSDWQEARRYCKLALYTQMTRVDSCQSRNAAFDDERCPCCRSASQAKPGIGACHCTLTVGSDSGGVPLRPRCWPDA